jgi:hypothetical protein
MAVESLGATLAVFLSMSTGPLAPVVAAAATPLTTRMMERIAEEWRRKSNVVAESALAASRLDPEDFCDALAGDPDMIALTQQVLWAASVSGNEQKLRGLGNLLGRAAAHPGDRLDETQVLIAALRDIEGPHLLVLEVLTGSSPDQWTKTSEVGWPLKYVAARVDLDPEFVPACLSALTRHGLATGVSGLDGERFRITQLGRAVALAMRGLGREPDQGT